MTARPLRIAAAVLALLAAATRADEPCAPRADFAARGWIDSGGLVIFYRTRPEWIEVGQPYALDVIVCAKDSALRARGLRIDAVMPNHRHGMNYRPEVTALGGDRYVVEGMLFHMPGRWRYFFDVELPDRTERLWQDIEVQ